MSNYSSKENYITRDPVPESWKLHPNGQLIRDIYPHFISGNVLDVGCNHGACTFLIAEDSKVSKVYGLDINPEAIALANRIKSDRNCNTSEFICSNILEWKTSMRFDVVVSFHTLEHIYPSDVDSFMQKLNSLLKTNGILLLSLPHDQTYANEPTHVAHYTEHTLAALCSKHGFETIECIYDNRVSEGGVLTGIFRKGIT